MNRLKYIFTIAVVVFLVSSCTKQTRVPIETHFWVPNSFSPGDTNYNDFFYVIPVYGVDIQEYHISIYDQNLQMVYESNDIEDAWDGKLNGNDMPEGYYEYQILYNASIDSVNYDDYITSSKINLFR